MTITNKGHLFQAFVNETNEVTRLEALLASANSKVSDLHEAIAGDEDLMEMVHTGGVATSSGDLIQFCNNMEDFYITKFVFNYSITDELNDVQSHMTSEPVADIEFTDVQSVVPQSIFELHKQALEYGERILSDLVTLNTSCNRFYSDEQLAILTEAEARGNGK